MNLVARFRRRPEPDVIGCLSAVVDGLRSGMSLRHAVLRTAGTDGSPLAPIAPALDAGRPLADALHSAAAQAEGVDVRCALSVLAAHADAGGDPVPAVSALATRLRRRQAARREARALTTQARLGARAMLLLTPGFWLLLMLSDPRQTISSLSRSGPRNAIVAGIVLQLAGSAWIGSIVRRAAGPVSVTRFANVPVLRAGGAIVGGRTRSGFSDEIAEGAETLAFVLDAGRSASGALEAVAPLAHGEFGDRLVRTVAQVRAGARITDALHESFSGAADPAGRLVDAFDASVSLGVPLAPALRSLADDVRERSVVDMNEDVRRASVRVLVPLGLLILPAFVLSCLVPLFAGGLVGLSGSG